MCHVKKHGRACLVELLVANGAANEFLFLFL